MTSQSGQTEEAYQRSDLHALSSLAERNNFNVRKFRDKALIKDKRKSLYAKYTDSSSKNKILTQPFEDRISQFKSSMYYTNAFERIMTKNQPDHEKRNAYVGSLKGRIPTQNSHSVDSYQLQRNKNQLSLSTEMPNKESSKYKVMQKKIHTGPINKKMIETWLNSILMETAQFELVDQSLGNAALKKYEIDENSLLSRSIKDENIEKIYRSLFVNSIGFNNSIKQLTSGNIQVMKNIWKVFSILLEYCAQGKFETVVGSIQRDKIMKVQQLREQVTKRQQIIDRNDELNQLKNNQIFKQIKSLKQENTNLTNQKEILFEDYQKTEQAFNEEVALRLKFENKINQLFGVHRELAIKHQRLYDDYKRKVIQWNAANQKNTHITLQNAQIKIHVNDLLSEKQRFLSTQKYNKQLIEAIKQQKIKLKDDYNILKHNYDEQRRLNNQNKRRITQLQIQIKNLSQIVTIKDKSWKQTHREYQLSLQQNNRLYKAINEQRTHIQQLLFDKKQFNNKTMNLTADASFEKKKKQQYKQLYFESDKKLNEKQKDIINLQLQIKINIKKCHSMEQDLQSHYINIKNMHYKNNELEDEVQYLRRFRDSIDGILLSKQGIADQYRQLNQILSGENQQLKRNLNKLQMTLRLQQAQNIGEIYNLNQKLQKVKEEFEIMNSGDNQKMRLIDITKNQLEKVKKILQNTILDFKNQKFQRFHLKANYDQSLSIIEKKNIQQKQMGRQISELKQLTNQTTRQRDRISFSLQNQTLQRERTEKSLSTIQQQFAQYRADKSSYIHCFIFEDVCQNFRKITQKYGILQMQYKMKIEELKESKQNYQRQITQIKRYNFETIKNLTNQKQKKIFQKQSQLQYEKQTKATMKIQLQKLQALQDTYAKKIEQRTTSEKQKIYAELIEQKTKSIDELMRKLNMQSQKNQILTIQMIATKQEHQKLIIQIKNKAKIQQQKRDEKINQINFELSYITKQSQKLIHQMKEQQGSFQIRLKERMDIYFKQYKDNARMYTTDSRIDIMPIQEEQTDGRLSKVVRVRATQDNWGILQKVQRHNPVIKKRNQMSKKIRLSYNYYKN